MSSVAPTSPQPLEEVRAFGPITRERLGRLGIAYLIVFIVGIGVAIFSQGVHLQAFGLGLAFPGGGFLNYLAGDTTQILLHISFTLASVLLFGFAFLVWFGTGNQAAPLIVWLGAAVIAASMSHEHSYAGAWQWVSLLAALSLFASWLIHRRILSAKLARREKRRALIGTWQSQPSLLDQTGLPQVDELSGDDLAALRYAFDRALQPVEEFNGFDFIDQFQPSAVRYQINNLSYVLSLANYIRLPAMRGYLHQAQCNLIEKKKQHRVWKYWSIESLWGNFRHEPNPIARDNVMYSGWYAAQIGLFERATGDFRYAEPGAITLIHPSGQKFVHDFHSIVKTLAENQSNSGFCLFPCEPNWIYPLCNNQAALGVNMHDRLHGTAYWAAVKSKYEQRLRDEFIDVDGHLTLFRSTRTGLTIPGLSSSSEDAINVFWMHPLFPDISNRLWEIARGELFEPGHGELILKPIKPWLDAGNYRFNTAYALGALSMAARELGDEEALTALLTAIGELETARHGGVLSYPGCSTWSHTFMLNARIGRTNGLANLVNDGTPAPWREGPVLDKADYPDVLPAKAVSDGNAFSGVFYPGDAGGRFKLGFINCIPSATYRCEGCVEPQVSSNEKGELIVNVDLDGRREMRLSPVQ
ncbi:MAG: linalool dehydratase/isomerase domain-containing protein [Gammaproteobacteria bacterium]